MSSLQDAITLIKAKKYEEARAILKTLKDDKSRELLKRLDEKYPPTTKTRESALKAKPAAKTKPADDTKPKTWLQRNGLIVVLVVVALLMVCGVIVRYVQVQFDQAFDGMSGQQLVNSSTLSVYCERIEAPVGDCDAWADAIVRADDIGSNICAEYYRRDYDYDKMTFCLLGTGLAPMATIAIKDVVMTDWNDTDYRYVAQMVNLCDRNHNQYWCKAWALVTYRDYRTQVAECGRTRGSNLDWFAECSRNAGVPVDIPG